MKKILSVLALFIALSFTAQAQFTHFGVRGGIGFAKHVDDIADNPAIMGVNVGAFVNYGFSNSQSLIAENLYLQTGLNIIRRGSHFEEVLDQIMSIREGSYSAWSVQLPVLVGYRYELPVREPGHVGLLTLGPAVSYGLFGTMKDRKITRGLPQDDWNYEHVNNVFNSTDGLNRLDVSFILGVGYEHQDLSVMLQLDYGFLSVKEVPDAMAPATNSTTNNNAVSVVPQGNNFALLLTVGYQFPIR